MQIKTHLLDFNSKSVNPNPLRLTPPQLLLSRKDKLTLGHLREIKYPKRLYNAVIERVSRPPNLRDCLQWIEKTSARHEKDLAKRTEAEIEGHFQKIETQKIHLQPVESEIKKRRLRSADAVKNPQYFKIFVKPKFQEMERQILEQNEMFNMQLSSPKPPSAAPRNREDNPSFLLCVPNKMPRIVSAFSAKNEAERLRVASTQAEEEIQRKVSAIRLFSAAPGSSGTLGRVGSPQTFHRNQGEFQEGERDDRNAQRLASAFLKQRPRDPLRIRTSQTRKVFSGVLMNKIKSASGGIGFEAPNGITVPISTCKFVRADQIDLNFFNFLEARLPELAFPIFLAPENLPAEDFQGCFVSKACWDAIFEASTADFSGLRARLSKDPRLAWPEEHFERLRSLFYGTKYLQKANFRKALEYFQRLLSTKLAETDFIVAFYANMCLGFCHFRLKDFNTSYQFAEKSLATAHRLNRFRVTATFNMLLCCRRLLSTSLEDFYLTQLVEMSEGMTPQERNLVYLHKVVRGIYLRKEKDASDAVEELGVYGDTSASQTQLQTLQEYLEFQKRQPKHQAVSQSSPEKTAKCSTPIFDPKGLISTGINLGASLHQDYLAAQKENLSGH